MHPFVALMRTYCIDYTNSHDQSLYDEFLDPDYVVHSFGVDLPRDQAYGPGVRQVFATAPGLGLVVHEFVLNGDRLAMHFSEHAAMPTAAPLALPTSNGAEARNGRVLTCWRGIGLYRWNGERLTENWVEQDYFAMQRQIETGVPDPILPPHLDPWLWTEPVPEDDGAVATVRDWLAHGDLADLADGGRAEIDDTRTGRPYEPVLDVESVVIDDVFSAGPSVPFHITVTGPYLGGLGAACEAHVGEAATMGISGIARVDRSDVVAVDAVTCRVQAAGSLTGRIHLGF